MIKIDQYFITDPIPIGDFMKNVILPMMLLTTLMNSSMINAQELPVVTAEGITVVNNLEAQATYSIGLRSVKVRATADDAAPGIATLGLNDKVKLVDGTVVNGKYVQITISKRYNDLTTLAKSEKYFIERSVLSAKPVEYTRFAVVNVASETLRLYERSCLQGVCSNKMVLETEVVVGEDVDHPADQPGKGRSALGSYRIASWIKFYEDGNGHYPAWYNESYPALPKVGNNGLGWTSKKVMPKDEKGEVHGAMRGAFGWYAAKVGPNAYNQWTHGTIGWGADKDAMVKRTKSPIVNIFSDPRSSGCTRNNNEAIAAIRNFLRVGDPIIKIYSREAIEDQTLSNYPALTESFDYILTKDKSSAAIARDEVLALKNFSPSMIVEQGTYEKDVRPDASPYSGGEKLSERKRKTQKTGNVYGVNSTKMAGTFYVDTGILEGYSHPTEILEVGGLNEVTPSFMTR
jgi:L,D-transpeptidase catalytic domain